MELVELRPPAVLRPHLHRAVRYEERCVEEIAETELPFAGAVLMVVLGDGMAIDGRRVRSFAAGVHDRPVSTVRGGDQQLLQLNLTPLGARRLFGLPMDELTNRTVDLDDVLDLRAETWPDLADALARRVVAAPAPRPEVELAHARIVASHGTVRVEELCRETGWSRRHLATQFRREVGITPKTLARIVRFERARSLLGRGRELADVAFECGFSDQPHFTREVRDLAGTTPAALTHTLD